MSFDFRTIKQPSNDPINAALSEIKKELAFKQAKDQMDQLDDTEDVFSDSQDIETKVSLNNLNHNHVFNFDKLYYPPKDPGWIVRTWWRAYNLGNTARDFATMYNHPATIHGDPILVDGVVDLGVFDQSVGVKSVAMRLNRPTSKEVETEYLSIPDHTDVRTVGIGAGNGFSVFVRVKLKSFTPGGSGGIDLRLFSKRDDSTSTPNDGVYIKIPTNGRIVVVIRAGGATVVQKETAAGTLTLDDTYLIFLTYAVTGNVCHVYTKKEPGGSRIDQTLSANADGITFPNTSDLAVNIGRGKSDGGYAYGDFYDYKLFRPTNHGGGHTGILSLTEVDNYCTNKMSISNIPFGQVGIANHAAMLGVLGLASFTSTSFTGTSFNT